MKRAIWKGPLVGPREGAVCEGLPMFPFLVWGTPDPKNIVGFPFRPIRSERWCSFMSYHEEQKMLMKNNALVPDLSTLWKILSPPKWFSCTTKVWGKLPVPVTLSNVIYALFFLSLQTFSCNARCRSVWKPLMASVPLSWEEWGSVLSDIVI